MIRATACFALVGASLLGCIARDAVPPASALTVVDPYPEGPYGFHEGEIYPPLLSLRAHYDPASQRGVRAIVLVVSSPTAFHAMHAREPLERQSAWGSAHLVALFDHTTQAPLDRPTLEAFVTGEKPRFQVFAAAPDDVAPGLVVHPIRFVIDPRTMRIVSIAEGIPQSSCDPDAEPLLRENGAPPHDCT